MRYTLREFFQRNCEKKRSLVPRELLGKSEKVIFFLKKCYQSSKIGVFNKEALDLNDTLGEAPITINYHLSCYEF